MHAVLQAPPQRGIAPQGRTQHRIILQHEVTDSALAMPANLELKSRFDLYCKKTKRSGRIPFTLNMSSFYLTDTFVSNGRTGTVLFLPAHPHRRPQSTQPVCEGSIGKSWLNSNEQGWVNSGERYRLVRAKHNRCLENEEQKLFDHMAQGKPQGTATISVPRQREKKGKPSKPGRPSFPARNAQVEVRFREVTICAPQTPQLKDKKSVKLWAIYLYEKNPPPGATRIKWMLLTTLEVSSLKQALKCVRWYCRRWRIEEWHRVLKSGCGVLDHQNQTGETLARTISIDAVVAWRIMLLALLGRELPDLPCELLFNPWECKVLELIAQKKKNVSLGEAIVLIAKLGGYLNRRCDGPPGFQSLWRGYARFNDMVYAIMLKEGVT